MVTVCGVTPVSAMVPVFPTINSRYRQYRGTLTVRRVSGVCLVRCEVHTLGALRYISEYNLNSQVWHYNLSTT